MPEVVHHLLLVRHAKAESPPGVDDHDRPLADRGRRDARSVGAWLAEEGLVPDRVLVSDALRTRQTVEALAASLPADVTTAVQPSPALYEASVHRVLDEIARTSEDVSTLAVVGHEPTMSASVTALTGRAVPFPTAAVAVIELRRPWHDVAGGTGTLLRTRFP